MAAQPRVAIVGGGIAGVLLGWRLRRSPRPVALELFTGGAGVPSSTTTRGVGGTWRHPISGDATAASGGLVRAFESEPAACRLAAESLAELRGSARLRSWAGYREVGALYLLPPGADRARSLKLVDAMLPGSVAVLDREALTAAYPLRGLPAGTTGVLERHAGYLSPARLRAAVLAEVAAAGCRVRQVPVTSVDGAPGAGGNGVAAVRLADGSVRGYDAVVVAAGAWTPRLLAAGGLDRDGLRTKQIQYSLHDVRLPGLGAFVEEVTGFYGRPAGRDTFLLGLPSQRWDVDPAAVEPDPALDGRVAAYARRRLGVRLAGPPARTVASFDCYHEPPCLALRNASAGSALFTFTGGSGGAAKVVLAASRDAAGRLMDLLGGPDRAGPVQPGPATGGAATPAGTGAAAAAAAAARRGAEVTR